MDTALPSLSPSELRAPIGRADAPLLLDVRRRERFAASDRLLPGALHLPPEQVAAFGRNEAPRDAVVYRRYGHDASADATRTLRAAGWRARYVQGGIEALATIVRGADTSRFDTAPPSAGLLAFSLGLSRLHADDHTMLQAALPMYDALYAWCREARDESHSWTAHAPAKVAA